MFPKAVDQHKPNKPLIPNGLGVVYVLISVVYLFLLYYFDYSAALPLAGCILFGGFMGLLDDWIDLRWRYKAFLPLFASLPLAVQRGEALGPEATKIATYFFGKIDFGIYFYIIVIPLIVTVTTNAINQLGGLNGLETICPSVVALGLMATSTEKSIFLLGPLLVYLILAFFNFRGKIFVGNTGSFAIGITLASYAVTTNNEQTLLIAILPYIFNSCLILANALLLGKAARLILEGRHLRSENRRSLLTIIACFRPFTERQLVVFVSVIVAFSTSIAVLVWLLV